MSAGAEASDAACGRCAQGYCCPLAAVQKERDEWMAEAERLRELILRKAEDRVNEDWRNELDNGV